jgi:photosystem II stability/assembly factor-like uncharacterized protein
MKKTSIILSLCCFVQFAGSCPTPAGENPDVVKQLIATYQSQEALMWRGQPGRPPKSIWRYEYKGQVVYYVSAQCCDKANILYDANGNRMCAPDGGRSGRGDGQCADFQQEGKHEQLVWVEVRAVHVLAIDPATPRTLYVGTMNDAAVFKSTDGGSTWSMANTGLARRNTRVTALAIDPTTPRTLYAATDAAIGTVFRSSDGGSTWSTLGIGLPDNASVHALAIDPTTPRTLYAGTRYRGVFKSTVSGSTWSAANTFLSNASVHALAIDPTTPRTLYAGTEDSGVFESRDGGSTWNAANTGLSNTAVTALAVDPTTPRTLYAGTRYGDVFKSTDSASTWSAAKAFLSNTAVTALAIDPTTPGTLYAGTGDGVFKSTDGGGTWSAPNLALPAPTSSVGSPDRHS